MQIKTKILAISSVFILATLSGCVTGPKHQINNIKHRKQNKKEINKKDMEM